MPAVGKPHARAMTAAPEVMRFNRLVPELYCADIGRSLRFYTEVAGFTVRYQRPENRFAYLERDGAQLMIEQPTDRTWLAAPLEYPFGRGINLQIRVDDVDALHDAVVASGARILVPMEEKWYRRDDRQLGNRQFVVLDPDGYLLRFFSDLGSRPMAP
jgi:catechol 2,3-dioxygenase-like lactoylglutathione lyase family enzyme